MVVIAKITVVINSIYLFLFFVDQAPSALIRFVENDTMYVLTPADIKKRGSLEAIVSHRSNNRLSSTDNLLENRQSSSATSNLFWQSIPLHKSIVHSFSQSQVIIS